MSSDGLRVLVLADSRAFHTERYVRELLWQGCVAIAASLERGTMPHEQLSRFGAFRQLNYFMAAPQTKALVKKFKPDIVNPHFASGYGHLASRVVKSDGPPIVCHLWGSDILVVPHKSSLHRWKTRKALTAARLVIGDSKYLVNEATKVAPMRRTAVIPWGIEREALGMYNPNRRTNDPIKVLMPRPHGKVYNTLMALRALEPLLKSGRVTLTAPRWGEDMWKFEEQAKRMGEGRVTLYTPLPRQEYLHMASEHDVYLSAARSDSSPASLIEAMALGLIPVVGDIRGVAEWVEGNRAVLFDIEDESSLRQAIESVVCDMGRFADLRERNHAFAVERAVFEDNVAKTIALMREVAGK